MAAPSSTADPAAAPETLAARKAADSGNPVEVLARRTETSQVFANPDGTFTQDRYAVAQWTRKGHSLVPIDTGLSRSSDGLIRPEATTVGLEFGGGGSKTLATITRDDRSVTFTWPSDLPRPAIESDTATYPEVIPGVDLKLRASDSGFSQLLVVKTPEAAADPALKTLAYGLKGDGVRLDADAHGNVSAINPAGQTVFTAPTPRMWDSGTAAAAPAARSTAAAGPSAVTSEFEPGHGAKQTAMPVDVDGDSLTLTPDQDLLTDESTRYPVYIDPDITGSRYSWTIAYKKYPNSSFFNGAGWGGSGKTTNEARAGYEDETNGLARSYFRMNTKNLWSTDKQVTKSTFRIKNTWSWSCTKRKVNLWRTAVIGASTTWNNRPERREKMDDATDSKGWGSGCPAGNLAFDVTKGAKDAASSKWNSITLELSADNESDVFGWKKFDAKSAVMSTTYNTPPSAPTSLDTIPSTANAKGCDVAPYGTIGNTDVTLTAKVSDKDGGTVTTRFHLWATGHHDDGSGVFFNQTVSVPSGTVAKIKVPKATLAAHETDADGNFSWKAQASDGSATSDWTPTLGAAGCRFVFDASRPSFMPGVASTEYPDGADGFPAGTGKARTPGTFTFSSGGVKDIESYEYSTDWDSTVRVAKPTAAGGSATVKLTPLSTGLHKVFVRSVDKVGNKSDGATYLFYADTLGVPDSPGDANGDGQTDKYGITADGTLRLYPGTGDGKHNSPSVAAASSFDGASITHRGDWTEDGYEDLIAAVPGEGGKKLYLYPNNGLGFACTALADAAEGIGGSCSAPRQELTVYETENDHFAAADQVLAIGDVDGGLDTDGDGEIDTPGYPDLLVKEGDFLWLYFGSPDNHLDSDVPPVLIGNSGWASYDVVAPGDVDHNGHVDLVSRNRTTGALYLYPGTGTAGEGLGYGPARVTLATSGWTSAARPLITSSGDADKDGASDLTATSTETEGQQLYFFPRLTTEGIGAPVPVGTTGWLSFQALS